MKETAIFRNIQHVPRIWGVTYVKLFAALGIGLLVTTVSFAVATHGSAIQKISLIGFGVGVTVVLCCTAISWNTSWRSLLLKDGSVMILFEYVGLPVISPTNSVNIFLS